jgi:hypothetical protein
LHLLVEIGNNFVEGLVNIRASMSMMSATIVHLITRLESYKTTFRVVIQALGKITKLLVKIRVGDVKCLMTIRTKGVLICQVISLDFE